MQPPCQELVAKDIHDNTWTFRHIFRGFTLFLIDYLHQFGETVLRFWIC